MRYKIQEYLTFEERDHLLKMPDQRKLIGLRDFCILKLMLFTGLRRAEICGLKRGSLKVSGKKIALYILGKGQRQRKIPLKDLQLTLALERYFLKIGTSGKTEAPMFYNYQSTASGERVPITPTTIRWTVNKYVKLAGIKKRITPHSLRHTCLTLLHQAGADAATVRDVAGHANISTTSRYLHTNEERMEKALSRLSL